MARSPEAYLEQHPGWWSRAACATDPGFLDSLSVEEQLDACDACPVRLACLAHAITTGATNVTQGGFIIGARPIHRQQWRPE